MIDADALAEVQALDGELALADAEAAPVWRALAPNHAEIDFFGVVGEDLTAKGMRTALQAIGKRDVTLRINSPGGRVFEGLAIFNMLAQHPGKKNVIVEAMAGSAASFIAMAGDDIAVHDSSFFMIHNSRTIAIGDRHTQLRTAAVSERIDSAMARIYSTRTGIPAAEIAEMMDAETWMTAAEAVEKGFATRLIEGAAATAVAELTPSAKALVAEYRAAPEAVLAMTTITQPPAAPAPQQEVALSDPIAQAGEVNAGPVAASLEQIQAVANRAKLDSDFVVAQLARKATLDAVNDAAIDALASKAPSRPATVVESMRDNRSAVRENMEHALMARAGLEGFDAERARAYAGMSLVEIARASIAAAGGNTQGMDGLKVAGAALGGQNYMAAAGLHTTSDFPIVLANVARKALMRGYNLLQPSWRTLARVVSHSDYKPVSYVRMGEAPALLETSEHQAYTYGTMAERGESMQVKKYGRIIGVTRELIINDDLSAFTRLPESFGYAAAERVDTLVWGVFTGNPTMSDGNALFSSAHANQAGSGGAINEATISAARKAMRVQTGVDGRVIQVAPRYLIVSPDKETEAQKFLQTVQNSDYSANIFYNSLTLIVSPRLTGNSWFLSADPAAVDTIYVAFLNGNETPRIEERMGFEVDGLEIKCAIDVGVAPIDWVGLYKNAGA